MLPLIYHKILDFLNDLLDNETSINSLNHRELDVILVP